MTRVSKLAECLYDGNFEMAVQMHRQDRQPLLPLSEPDQVVLLLAKAYFISDDYDKATELIDRIKDSKNIAICYEARMLLFKAHYLGNIDKGSGIDKLRDRIQREVKDPRQVNVLLGTITEVTAIT